MSKKIYSVSLKTETEGNIVKGFSFIENTQDVVGESFNYYDVKVGDFVGQKSKISEFKGMSVMLPNEHHPFSLFSTDPSLIEDMKKSIAKALVFEAQSKYQKAANAYKDFKRYKTSISSGEVIERDTFFEQLLLKFSYAKNEVKEYISNHGNAEIIINAGITLIEDKTHVYAEPLWITGVNSDGSLELTDYTHTPCDDVFESDINKIFGGNNPDFPFANIKIANEFDIFEIASKLHEKMAEQVDSYILDAQSKMENQLSLALSLKASI